MSFFSWQQLGGFVQNIENCTDTYLDRFVECGGKYILPYLYQDSSAEDNKQRLPNFINRCTQRNVRVGIAANGLGGDPGTDAQEISRIVRTYFLSPIVLDLELAYKADNAVLMPKLIKEMRAQFPIGTKAIGVTSFGFLDRAMIWNGRLVDGKSFYDHRIRFLPQWYPSYSYKYDPEWCMEDLQLNAAGDGNIVDPDAPLKLGVQPRDVHGVIECTGVELGHPASLITRMRAAKVWGFTKGFQLWLVERLPEEDVPIIKSATDLRLQ